MSKYIKDKNLHLHVTKHFKDRLEERTPYIAKPGLLALIVKKIVSGKSKTCYNFRVLGEPTLYMHKVRVGYAIFDCLWDRETRMLITCLGIDIWDADRVYDEYQTGL